MDVFQDLDRRRAALFARLDTDYAAASRREGRKIALIMAASVMIGAALFGSGMVLASYLPSRCAVPLVAPRV